MVEWRRESEGTGQKSKIEGERAVRKVDEDERTGERTGRDGRGG